MKNVNRINVTRPFLPDFDEYMQELRPVWESHYLANRGSAVLRLEAMLREYLGVKNAVCFANGHAALEIAIQTLDFPRGSEIITTPYTFCSTTHAIVRSGMTPVFADIEPVHFNIDPDSAASLITPSTRAIVATHVYGFPCDVGRIEEIAGRHGLCVIYDAAHAFGVKYRGSGIGNFGDASMFSTHATKAFHTIEGGILTYNDARLGPVMSRGHFGLGEDDEVSYIGTDAWMNEFEAVMGIVNLRHIGGIISGRRAVAHH